MKSLYSILCVILAFFILLFLFFHIEYSPVVIDKKIHEHTTSLLKSNKKIDKTQTKPLKKSEKLSSEIWTLDLFDPLRGELESSVSNNGSSKEPADMELIGICNTDTLKGAIILLKKNSFRSSSKNKRKSSFMAKEKQRKRFFIVEDRLPNGYTLKEVKTDLVTLSKGNEQVLLKLKFDDNDTTDRISTVASNPVRAQLNNIKREKNRSLLNNPKTSVKISPVNKKTLE
jgi:hypothetical protein